jgi:hypothetical protein
MGQRWGKQIAVAMTESDEKTFLASLRRTTDIGIFASHAPTREELDLAELPKRRTSQTQFFLWNKQFAWEPAYAPTTSGSFHVREIHPRSRHRVRPGSAPLLQPQQRTLVLVQGNTPGGPYEFKSASYAYNAEEFEKRYKLVVSWVKENSKSKRWGDLPVYQLSNAWCWYAWRIP